MRAGETVPAATLPIQIALVVLKQNIRKPSGNVNRASYYGNLKLLETTYTLPIDQRCES